MKSIVSTATGERMTTHVATRTDCSMPDDERSGLYDPEEEFAWDFDQNTYSESEVADLLDEEDCE